MPRLTWREFVKGKMGPYMKSEGGHAGAMARLGAEWKAYKAGLPEVKTDPPIDMLEPFRQAAKEAVAKFARGETTEIVVKGTITIDPVSAAAAPFAIAALLLERIGSEITNSSMSVLPQTRERRERALRELQKGRGRTGGGMSYKEFGKANMRQYMSEEGSMHAAHKRIGKEWHAYKLLTPDRYPVLRGKSYMPNPQGPYGEDSGLLRDEIAINYEAGNADVFMGIPKIRQKAAFILRTRVPSAGAELPAAVNRTAQQLVKEIVRKSIAKAVRAGLKGTGARAKFL